MPKNSICLVMIVKNEEKVIRTCLESVKNYIDCWVIVDTGSTDNTKQVIIDAMQEFNIKGQLYDRPWVNYGHNRTESLELAKGICDYRLIIDADDMLQVDEGIEPFTDLQDDGYRILIELGRTSYYRTQLIKSNQDWKYIGVLHEYLEGPEPNTQGIIEGVKMIASVSGHTKDIKGSAKYYNDALIFEKELITNPDLDEGLKSRYTYYLAQSYRDAEMYDRALEFYKKRIEMQGWDEEVYICKLSIAHIKNIQNRTESEVIEAYMTAWEYRPFRLESVYYLMKYLSSRGRYFLAFSFGTTAIRMPPCNDILFVEQDIWKWRLNDEYCVLAWHLKNLDLALQHGEIILNSKNFSSIPSEDQKRIQSNVDIYREAKKRLEDENSKN